ncbi:MAG: hypothetical protein IT319_03180, partial [Anaerolineae bacterium]|nr:hypothetical protein [Anaerolineae bacterium]
MDYFEQARRFIREFKGDRYLSGAGVLARSGELAARAGSKATVIRRAYRGSQAMLDRL